MTRFEFPLDRLLAVRRQLVRRAEAAQALARAAWDRAGAEARAARDAWDRHADETAAGVGRVAAAGDWHATVARGERLADALASREADAAAAAAAYEAADRERVKRAREVEALETLRERRRDEWARDVARADQDRLDEIGVRRWAAAAAAGEDE